MTPTARLLALPLALLLMTAPTAPAQDRVKAASEIVDDAGMFSKEAVRKAQAILDEADKGRDLVVTLETVATLRGQEVEEFANRRADQIGHKGIFILIAKQERKFEVLASPRSFRDALGRPRITSIIKTFGDEFRKGSPDDGLVKGIQAASSAIDEVRRPTVATGSGAGLAPSGSSTSAVSRQQTRLTLTGARQLVAAAEAAATRLGYKVSVAVVDDGGHLLSLDRMDGSNPTGPNAAIAAAASAIGIGLTASNSAPIVLDGQLVGGMGVSGSPNSRDSEVVQAAFTAFIAGLKAQAPTQESKPKTDEEPRPKPAEEPKAKTTTEGEKIDITIPRPDEVGRLKPGGDAPR